MGDGALWCWVAAKFKIYAPAGAPPPLPTTRNAGRSSGSFWRGGGRSLGQDEWLPVTPARVFPPGCATARMTTDDPCIKMQSHSMTHISRETAMTSQNLEPLILDMMEWLNNAPRTYPEVMDTWRTSCPRLTVWEDAVDQGLVARGSERDVVLVTGDGEQMLRRCGRRTWCISQKFSTTTGASELRPRADIRHCHATLC
jgi:hypothetical protein